MADDAPLIVNKSQLARLFRVSLPTIDGWVEKRCPIHKGGSNGVAYEFDVDQVKTWRDAEDAREAEAEAELQRRIGVKQAEMFDGARLAPEGAGDIKEALEAERLALIVGKQKGELVAREDVRNDYAAVFGIVRQHLLGYATTLGRTAHLSADQQKEADRLVRSTLEAMHGQIKDPELRPVLNAD